MGNENIKAKILIIEDNEAERLSLKVALESVSGMYVEVAETGAEAEAVVGSVFFDVLIVDYRLPDIDGLNLIKKLKLISSDLMPIVVTAHSSVEIAVEAMEMGAYDYMAKPLDIASLLKTIDRILLDREKLVSSKEKLSKIVANNEIKYAYNDENIVVISTPDTDILLEHSIRLNLIDMIKYIFKTIKNYYWGS